MKLKTLLLLQGLYGAASLTFLAVSGWRAEALGAPLSAAPVIPSMLGFGVYIACLFLPRLGQLGWYRIAMVVAIAIFGGGGVAGNIVNYVQSGLAHYSSFASWVLAVGINSYGTVFNIIAALGRFDRPVSRE